jgi:hypothetical protein
VRFVRVVQIVVLNGGRDPRPGECGGRLDDVRQPLPLPAAAQVGLHGGVSEYGDDWVFDRGRPQVRRARQEEPVDGRRGRSL